MKWNFLTFFLFSLFQWSSATEVKACGRKLTVNNRIYNGGKIEPNSWPWLVALNFISKNMFFCSGSLISNKHVLSAAHCFQNKVQAIPTPPQNIVAFVGKHNLSSPDEDGSSKHPLTKIVNHPDWNYGNIRFDADISLLTLVNEVKFTEFVKPVCLPKPTQNELYGAGNVIGWGKSEYSEALGLLMDPTPNELVVPIVSQEDCFLDVHLLAAIASKRTFCAGYMNRSKSVCQGDSGSGLYIREQSTGLYYVKGIVSSSLVGPKGCNIEVYSIYTNVVKFTSWIKEEMQDGKVDRGEKIKYKCWKDLLTPNEWVTCCQECEVAAENAAFFELVSNDLVNDIGKKFNQLRSLVILKSYLKFLANRDFQHLGKLESFKINRNQIESLPDDVFWDLPNLKELNVQFNPIKRLPEKIFSNLANLEIVDFNFNKINFLPKDLFKENHKLMKISFAENPLRKVEINFTLIPFLAELDLYDASCINAVAKNSTQIEDAQEQIQHNCTFH